MMQRSEARRAFWRYVLAEFERGRMHALSTVALEAGVNAADNSLSTRRLIAARDNVEREIRRKAGV